MGPIQWGKHVFAGLQAECDADYERCKRDRERGRSMATDDLMWQTVKEFDPQLAEVIALRAERHRLRQLLRDVLNTDFADPARVNHLAAVISGVLDGEG